MWMEIWALVCFDVPLQYPIEHHLLDYDSYDSPILIYSVKITRTYKHQIRQDKRVLFYNFNRACMIQPTLFVFLVNFVYSFQKSKGTDWIDDK